MEPKVRPFRRYTMSSPWSNSKTNFVSKECFSQVKTIRNKYHMINLVEEMVRDKEAISIGYDDNPSYSMGEIENY